MPDRAVPSGLVIHTERHREAVLLALQGEVDLTGAPELARELLDAEVSGGRIIVDLGGVEFMDCSGLRTLLEASSRCNENGCQLSLLPGPRQVQRIFELTGTLDRFIFDDRAPQAAKAKAWAPPTRSLL
jgi:anti-anti-sigma factor